MREGRVRNIKIGAACALALAAGALVAARWRAIFPAGERGARTYFYDQSERRLYEVERGTVPPDVGIGGVAGDGVRAVVVAPAGEQSGRTEQRIAYLESYSPALHEQLAAIRDAKKQGRGAGVNRLGGDDPFVLKNTLVRREHETEWHDMTTPQARTIVGEWVTWRDGAGKPLIVIAP